MLLKMLGDFLTRGLVLAFGYAYPAFECFKTVEKNKVEIEQLRFWCQYWIIVAVITVFERISDVFMSWLPLYGEAKLALFIYLWYPKTKGCGFVYETIVRPYVANHETDIDRCLLELRARALDLAIFYWQNCAKIGAAKFFQTLQYLASQSANVPPSPKPEVSEKDEIQHPISETPSTPRAPPPPPSPPSTPSTPPPSLLRKHKVSRPMMPPLSPTRRRSVTQSPRSVKVQTHLEHIEEETAIMDEDLGPSPKHVSDHNGVDQKLNGSRLRPGRLHEYD